MVGVLIPSTKVEKSRLYNWSLIKEDVEKKLNKKISDSEFECFFDAFNDYFKIEYNSTLDWLSSEWDEIKWDYI